MNSEKGRRNFKIFVTIALAGSLVLNFFLLSKLDQLENQIYSVTNLQQTILNGINGQTSEIQNIMNDIKEEQSWISTINMETNHQALAEGRADATFTWQVKELESDAKVYFNYAYGNTEEYTELPAEELQQGMFKVSVPIEVPLEPQWDYSLIHSNSNNQEMNQKEIEEKRLEQYTLKYFVSVSSGDLVKSSDIQTEQLAHLGTNYYGVIQTNLQMDKDKNFSVMLTNHTINGSSLAVEEAYLLKYKEDVLIGEEEIQLDEKDDAVRFFYLPKTEQYEDMRLVIKVVYSDGKTFEKQVYEVERE